MPVTSTPLLSDSGSEQIGIPESASPSTSSRSESPVNTPPKISHHAESATDHFENTYYDEYDYYNLTPDNKLFTHASGKGRSKREASKHTSRLPSHWGIFAKFENEANNRKRNNIDSKTGRHRSISK